MTESMRPLPQRTIGILGGCSNVATGEYYRLLNAIANERMGGWEIAETLIAGMNFGNIEAFVREDDWDGLARYMDGKVEGLAAGGADILLCVSNTLHRSLEPIAERHGLDLIHIADPTAAAIKSHGLRRVALFGTRPVMEQDYLTARYRDRHGIEVVVPNAEERAEIDRIIFDELVKANVREVSRARYYEIAERLVRDEGAEGVILGCTEIFLLMRQDDRPDLRMFDTTRLHCEAAVKKALALEPASAGSTG